MYFDHGAYFFKPPRGNKIHLGRVLHKAIAKYAELVQPASELRTLGDVMDRYLKEIAPTKAPRTYQDNLAEMRRLREVFGETHPDDLTPKDIYRYMDLRKAPMRANREKALLSMVFKYAIRWGLATSNPCSLVQSNKEKPRERYVTTKELRLFMRNCPAWLRCFVRLKYLTGLRQGDLLKLSKANITPEGLYVRTGKRNKAMLYRSTAALSRVLAAILRLHRPASNLMLFVSERTNRPLSQKGFKSAWQRAMQSYEAAGGVRFWEHDLRAKSASDSGSLVAAQELLGHEDAKTTARVYRRGVQKVTPIR